MHVRIGLLLILLGFALSAQVGGAPAAAQSAASAALQNEAMEIDQNASEEPDEGFWDGMVSSILDFFGDDSEDEEERRQGQDRSPNMRGAVNAENTPTRAVSDTADDGRTHELAVRAADTAPSQPGRRLNLRRVHVSADNITPSHVYQATRDLVSEIVILRQAMNVTEVPGEITLQQHQAPIHAYAKCLEVLGKAARVQRRLGMIPVDVKHIPVKVIDQSDVHNCVQTVIKELRRIKRQMVIKTEIQPAPLVGGKAPLSHLREAHVLVPSLGWSCGSIDDTQGPLPPCTAGPGRHGADSRRARGSARGRCPGRDGRKRTDSRRSTGHKSHKQDDPSPIQTGHGSIERPGIFARAGDGSGCIRCDQLLVGRNRKNKDAP